MEQPRLSYLICSDRRSGSTLLCEALRGTGIAGAPAEYFNPFPPVRRMRMKYLGAEGSTDYLAHVIEKSTTPNGVFGTKVHGDELSFFLARATQKRTQDLYARLPSLHFIRLVRTNIVRQAISLLRAKQTRRWWQFVNQPALYRGAVEMPERDFDAEGIRSCLALLEESRASWDSFFKEHGITPFLLAYEELAADYEKSIRNVLGFLGLPTDISIPPPQTLRQADALTDEWEKRFLQEM